MKGSVKIAGTIHQQKGFLVAHVAIVPVLKVFLARPNLHPRPDIAANNSHYNPYMQFATPYRPPVHLCFLQ
jgi:hypothetical protein